jgi:hypothetical protein
MMNVHLAKLLLLSLARHEVEQEHSIWHFFDFPQTAKPKLHGGKSNTEYLQVEVLEI